jgi:hypothetical protein
MHCKTISLCCSRVEFREGGLKSEFEQRSQNFSNSPGMPVYRKKILTENKSRSENKNFLLFKCTEILLKDKNIYTELGIEKD